jgi:two-component system OmpR family sensor kinase
VRHDFLATTVHDVQQPLSVVKARIRLISRELNRPAPRLKSAQNGLRSIEDEIDRLTGMLRGLADASRLGLGAFELKRSSGELVELVRQAIARTPPGAADQIRLHIATQPITGEWDRALLERVFDNVLSNAIKYSPPNTPVEVTVAADTDVAELSVHDQGMGLSSTELEAVFERYHRAQAAVERGIRGQGLGLYLARGVVEAHGGRMWLESPGPGFGTTVFVRLPRTSE